MTNLVVKGLINIIFYIVLIVLGTLITLPYISIGKHITTTTQHVVDTTNAHTARVEEEAQLLGYTLDSK